MDNLFKKAACFTDLHLGLRQNSRLHLDDCDRFVTWFIDEAKVRGCETCIFLGDWQHHRSSINVATMNESIKQLKRLNDSFEKVYFITGNHDLFYRDRRDLNSVEYARDLPNVVIVDEHFVEKNVAILPWLVGDEHKKVHKYKVKYIFGHMEIPFFKMNAMVEMPDHDGIQEADLSHADFAFSGHFHKRQRRENIFYIGNAFPHNYADAGDNDRGAMFLEWGGEPELVNWTECPKYIVVSLKDLITDPSKYLDKYTYARVKIDIPISYEEATFIKETFSLQYNVRELQLITIKEETEYEGGNITFESVDQIVVSQLSTLESGVIKKERLISLYNDLII